MIWVYRPTATNCTCVTTIFSFTYSRGTGQTRSDVREPGQRPISSLLPLDGGRRTSARHHHRNQFSCAGENVWACALVRAFRPRQLPWPPCCCATANRRACNGLAFSPTPTGCHGDKRTEESDTATPRFSPSHSSASGRAASSSHRA